ncbi:zinc finger matrin-type protein 5-like [Oncorhynchus masou masou]|uniref:zinc finger matrin-type protein 5-like n=1 Tax=Oncorhynchus masou masou TaxID=90313 RepID=UPI0031830260
MGKRYYCDCDRPFQDNMHNRKKHMYGFQHHRSKKAWFDHFRDERWSREDPEHRASPERSIEEFLTRGEKRRATLSSGSVLKEEDDDNQPENDIPPHFLTIPDLPPSLLPPPPSGSKVWLN